MNEPVETAPTPKGTVFVVEDDESVRNAVARLLRASGFEAVVFPSAEDFLEGDTPRHACCVVLDIGLPGASGLALQEELRRRGRAMPIIFVTGQGDVPTSVRAMKAGALDFLEKPFDELQLLDAVRWGLERDRKLLRERRKREQVERRLATLTPREREVMDWVVRGLLNKQIAAELGASEKTIKVHRARVMRKMKADSVADLVRMAETASLFDT